MPKDDYGDDAEMEEQDLMYDPDQNPEERREIRKGYRRLQEDGTARCVLNVTYI